jgi:hypothetical protein
MAYFPCGTEQDVETLTVTPATNVSIKAGGAYRYGKLVVVNLRLLVSANFPDSTPLVTISKEPKSSLYPIGFSAILGTANSATPAYFQLYAQSGTGVLAPAFSSSIASGRTALISCSYLIS